MCMAQELSTNVWHKTGSNVSRRITPTLKDKPRSGILVEDELKIVEQASTNTCI